MKKILVDFFAFKHNICSPQVKGNLIYCQKVNIQVISPVAGRLKFSYLRELGNFMRIPQIYVSDGKVLSLTPHNHNLTVVLTNCKKSEVKHSIEKPMLLNFFNLSTIIFQGRLWKNVFISNLAQTPCNLHFGCMLAF